MLSILVQFWIHVQESYIFFRTTYPPLGFPTGSGTRTGNIASKSILGLVVKSLCASIGSKCVLGVLLILYFSVVM